MKVSQFLLFLAALTGTTSNLVFKKHVHVNTPMIWSVARDYCRENHVDLSIIDTQEEFNRFKIQMAANAGVRSFIGLSKNPGETKYTQWCNGTVLSFTSWSPGEPSGIYSVSQNEVIVIEEKKTWDEALEHCRTYYTDLISVTTQTDLVLVNDIRLNITTSFWTGLRFLNGLWFWVNQEPLGSLVSMPSCPNHPFSCGARKAGVDTWENRDCREKMFYACYRQGSG